MNQKTCTKCGQTKPVEYFYKSATGLQGRRPSCISCIAASNKEHYQHRAERQAIARTQHANATTLFAEGRKQCTKCGQIKPLCAFAKSKDGRYGLRPECRRCASQNPTAYRSRAEQKAVVVCRERARIKNREEREAQRTAKAPRRQSFASAGQRICRTCGQGKPLTDFPPVGKNKWRPDCRACLNVKPSVLANTRGQFTPNRFRVEGDTAYIQLTDRNDVTIGEAMISASDLSVVLARGRWNIARAKERATNYAARSYRENGKAKLERLHRFIMQPLPGLVVDHRNGDGLNNTRDNLRVVTQSENLRNQRRHREAAQSQEAKAK